MAKLSWRGAGGAAPLCPPKDWVTFARSHPAAGPAMGACGVLHSWGLLLLPAVPWGRGRNSEGCRLPARVMDLAARDLASPGGREQHGGGVVDLHPPHPQRWWQQAVRSRLAALGEGDTQAVMPDSDLFPVGHGMHCCHVRL